MSDLYSPSRTSFNAPPLRRESGPVSERLIEDAAATRPWVLFISIMLFCIVGIFLLISLFAMFQASTIGVGPSAMIFCSYAFMAVLYFATGYLLFKYAQTLNSFLSSEEIEDFEEAFTAQKRFWKFFGIMLLCSLLLMIGMILFAVFIGSFAGLRA